MRCKVFIVLLVATVLTVYGIETILNLSDKLTRLIGVATVLTVYGIETCIIAYIASQTLGVATVLTVYGIETGIR